MGVINDIIQASKVVDAQMRAEQIARQYALRAILGADKLPMRLFYRSTIRSNEAKNLRSLAGRKLKKLRKK